MVTRYVNDYMDLNGSYVEGNSVFSKEGSYMTKDFIIQKYDHEEGDFNYVYSSSLGRWFGSFYRLPR
ncbi:hypothetical protein OROHE_019826 [Orobanche hederae]